jgi:hypothetical protein
MFTNAEKQSLLERLPSSLELSYAPKIHKKVSADLFWVIPKGQKCLIWYTYLHAENVCLLIHLNERGNYSDVKIYHAVFSSALAFGTILYGTFFYAERQPFFTCEQIHYAKGVDVQRKSAAEKMAVMHELFTNNQIGQVAYTPDFLIVGLPVMTQTYEEAEALLNVLPYRTYGVGAYHLHKAPAQHIAQAQHTSHTASAHTASSAPAQAAHTAPAHTPKVPMPLQPRTGFLPTKCIFKVKADLVADVYHLYCADNIYYTTVAVSSYKMSVQLNALFRNIKENANLDLLEESDEEEEFENTEIDRFVDLEKTVLMECGFVKKTQKWQLLNVIMASFKETGASLKYKEISVKEAKHFENK